MFRGVTLVEPVGVTGVFSWSIFSSGPTVVGRRGVPDGRFPPRGTGT